MRGAIGERQPGHARTEDRQWLTVDQGLPKVRQINPEKDIEE